MKSSSADLRSSRSTAAPFPSTDFMRARVSTASTSAPESWPERSRKNFSASAEAKENAKTAGVENLVRFEENDLFRADIHEASVVTLFLLSSVNLKLRPKLLQDLKPGTRIV